MITLDNERIFLTYNGLAVMAYRRRDRLFYNIRPYFKTYRVGSREFRGANAGDFAAVNTIDVMLGLCSPHDP
jgi:hypothetical protein